LYNEDDVWLADESWEFMDASNVDKLLASSVKKATAVKYGRICDKWAVFAAVHHIEAMPPEVRGLEIFIADTDQLSESAGVATTAAAAVAHFCAFEGYLSPFWCPRFGKLLRGICNRHGKAARPKKPFTPDHIISFMLLARHVEGVKVGSPVFQQLLRGSKVFDLNGSNVTRMPGFYCVEVKNSKNHPEGFSFWIPVDENSPNCVGVFFADFITVMGISLRDLKSFFACKISKSGGVIKSVSLEKVATSTMRGCCKDLIFAAGLDPTEYATHSSKRGGTLEAIKAGHSDAQTQKLGRWSSSTMVARYARGNEETRNALAGAIRI
jgi:hypothetical protein